MSYSEIFRFIKILILEKKLYGNRKKILNKVQFKFFIKKIFLMYFHSINFSLLEISIQLKTV